MRLGVRAFVATIAATTIGVTPAFGSSTETGFEFSGPGITKRGAPVTATFSILREPDSANQVPDRIQSISLSAPSLKLNLTARGLGECRARIKNDGLDPGCPKRSLIGTGSLRGVIGTPGRPADEFGLLSRLEGRIRLYNFRGTRRVRARFLVVVQTTKPFRGVFIPVIANASSTPQVRLAIPRLTELPKVIGSSYPVGTEFSMTSIRVALNDRRSGRTRLLASRRPFDFVSTIDLN